MFGFFLQINLGETVESRGKNELKNGTDYTIAAASGNPVYDKCTFILTGKGSYTGIKKFTITIKKRTLD